VNLPLFTMLVILALSSAFGCQNNKAIKPAEFVESNTTTTALIADTFFFSGDTGQTCDLTPEELATLPKTPMEFVERSQAWRKRKGEKDRLYVESIHSVSYMNTEDVSKFGITSAEAARTLPVISAMLFSVEGYMTPYSFHYEFVRGGNNVDPGSPCPDLSFSLTPSIGDQSVVVERHWYRALGQYRDEVYKVPSKDAGVGDLKVEHGLFRGFKTYTCAHGGFLGTWLNMGRRTLVYNLVHNDRL
jgi:hypothetical protein